MFQHGAKGVPEDLERVILQQRAIEYEHEQHTVAMKCPAFIFHYGADSIQIVWKKAMQLY